MIVVLKNMPGRHSGEHVVYDTKTPMFQQRLLIRCAERIAPTPRRVAVVWRDICFVFTHYDVNGLAHYTYAEEN